MTNKIISRKSYISFISLLTCLAFSLSILPCGIVRAENNTLRLPLSSADINGKNRLASSMSGQDEFANTLFPSDEDIKWFRNAAASNETIGGESVIFVGASDTQYLWLNKKAFVDLDNNVVFIAEGADNRPKLKAQEVFKLKRWRRFIEDEGIMDFRKWADENPKEYAKEENRINRDANLFLQWERNEWDNDIELAFEALEAWHGSIKQAKHGLTPGEWKDLYENPWAHYLSNGGWSLGDVGKKPLLIASMIALTVLCAVVLSADADTPDENHHTDINDDSPDVYNAQDMPQDMIAQEEPYIAQNTMPNVVEIEDVPKYVEDENRLHKRIQRLIERLPYDDKAMDELKQIGEPVVNQLIEALSSRVNQQAEKALIEIGKPAVPLLMDALLHDQDFWVRRYSAETLGCIGDPIAVDSLIRALSDSKDYVVMEACVSLGQIGDERAVKPLIMMSEGTYPDTNYHEESREYVEIAALSSLCQIGHKASIQKMLDKALSYESGGTYGIRDWVVSGLAQVKDVNLLEPLFLTVRDPLKSKDVKGIALEVLEHIVDKVNFDVFDYLQPVIGDESLTFYVSKILTKIKDPRVNELLLSRLDDKNHMVRFWAIIGLGNLRYKPALDKLISMDVDGDEYTMEPQIVRALGKFKDERALPRLLIDARQSRDSSLAEEAVKAIGEIDTKASILALIDLCTDKDVLFVTYEIREALRKIKDPESVRFARTLLINAFQDVSEGQDIEQKQTRLIDAFSSIAQAEDILPIIKALEKYNYEYESEDSYSGNMVKTMVEILERIGDNSLPIIMPYAHNEKPMIRSIVIKALGKLYGEENITLFIDTLQNDKNLMVRKAAIEALGNAGGTESIEALINIVKNDEVLPLLEKAGEALIKIGGDKVFQSLINLVSDNNVNVRINSIDILGKLGNKEAVEPLIKFLEDKNDPVRIHTARALSLLQDVRACKPLFNTLGDKIISPEFQKAVEEALIDMGANGAKGIVPIIEGIPFNDRLFGKGLQIVTKIYQQKATSNEVLEYLTRLLPQVKEIIKTNDVEMLEDGFFVLNVILTSSQADFKLRKEIWDIYYSFVSKPTDFPFFVDPGVPPIFKSVTTNSVGFTLLFVLKGKEFSVEREGYLDKLITLTQERIKSKDKITYMLGRSLAYNLTNFLYEKDIELNTVIKQKIEELNKMNTGPDESIFEDNIITVKLYFQESMKENIWVKAYINSGFGFKCTYFDNTVRIFEKKDVRSGRILKIIIPRAPLDPKDFKGTIFEDFNENGAYRIDYLGYNGHAGMGVELEESFKKAQAYFKAPIIQLSCCWSKNSVAKIQKLFPLAAPILTDTGAMSLDGLLIFAHTAERLLRYGKDTKWKDVRSDIDANTANIRWNGKLYYEEKKGNRIFPDEEQFRRISDIDGDGIPDFKDGVYDFKVAWESRDELNFNWAPVSDEETPEDKASDVIGAFNQYLSDDPFLGRHNICMVDPGTEGLNKGWFWPQEDTKEPARIKEDSIDGVNHALISLNIGYRDLSRESLMLMGLVETAKYIGEKFKDENKEAIGAMEGMLDIDKKHLDEEIRNARELLGVSLDDTKDVLKKLGITTEEDKAKILNPVRGFLLGMEYIEYKYKLSLRTIDLRESTNEERETARIYIIELKNLYAQFLEKYNLPMVSFEDMLKILDVSKNNPTIWYLAYIAKNGIAIPKDIGKMNIGNAGADLGVGKLSQPDNIQNPLEPAIVSSMENRNAI